VDKKNLHAYIMVGIRVGMIKMAKRNYSDAQRHVIERVIPLIV
jgi:hypothetical protein